jgi:hypothetical protein
MCHLLAEMAHIQPPMPTQIKNRQHLGWLTAISNLGKQKPWTCSFTGYIAKKPNNNSVSIGAPARLTWATTGQKHHCAAHHIKKCNTILTPQSIITALQESHQHMPVQLAAKAV